MLAFAALVPGYIYSATSERGLNPAYLARQFLISLGDLTSYKTTPSAAVYAFYVSVPGRVLV